MWGNYIVTYCYVPYLLFQFENMLIELLLEFFVRVIDTKLLEWILFEMFKSINIKYTDECRNCRCVRWRETVIDDTNKPFKQVGIDVFGNRILYNICLCGIKVCDNLFRTSNNLLANNPFAELSSLDSKQAGSCHQRLICFIQHRIASASNLDITDMQQCC